MTSRAPVAANGSVVTAGNDLNDARGLQCQHMRMPRTMFSKVETNLELEAMNNEGSGVNIGLLKTEMDGGPKDVRRHYQKECLQHWGQT
jgi:hypothetical protein